MPSADKSTLLTLDPAAPAAEAAATVLAMRLSAVARLAAKGRDSKLQGPKAVKLVHALRVATRRGQAALDTFAPALPDAKHESLSKALRTIRKAAGAMRDAHVQIEALGRAAELATSPARVLALEYLASRAAKRGAKARAPLQAALAAARTRRLSSAPKLAAAAAPLRHAAHAVLTDRVGAIQTTAAGNLADLVHVHELRVQLKAFRYTLEIFSACVPAAERPGLLEPLAAIQATLGTLNDAFTLHQTIDKELARLSRKAGPSDPDARRLARALTSLQAEQARLLKKSHRAFLKEWSSLCRLNYFERVITLVAPPAAKPARDQAPHPARIELKPLAAPTRPASLNGHARKPAAPGNPERRRLAAIDVGTNSVRLIVAEADDDGSYRVLDDEKEITRLGHGLSATGRMDPARIEHTAATIARMRAIAEGYGAAEPRVVGTSASREAANGPDLVARIREASGLEMHVISGDEEALLAFRSAARAFDLSAQPALVFDIGGGSVELVLSAGGHGGLIERVYSLPLGAVRLTEHFGGASAASLDRFDELRDHIRSVLKKAVGRPPIWPQIVVGTGGTLTTLGLMALRHAAGPHGNGDFGKVQGTPVTRAEVRHLLDYVRKLPVKDRTKVSGLGADRIDIIVAGLAVVDALLKHFGANRLKVHEGGIRDGLLLEMVEPAHAAGSPSAGDRAARPDPIKGVRRFAKECNYEAAHAHQVTRLALRIFDGLARHEAEFSLPAGASFGPEARTLLEAASILHDVGYLINYAQHHKHAYHLIVHADLPGLTARQVQIVALVARYHRAADPKPRHGPFERLGHDDRALVRQLSAILRVADGLDRTHMQSVRDLSLAVNDGSVDLALAADAEPEVDIWGAVRKSGLFRKVFKRPVNVEWTRTAATTSTRPVAARVSAA